MTLTRQESTRSKLSGLSPVCTVDTTYPGGPSSGPGYAIPVIVTL